MPILKITIPETKEVLEFNHDNVVDLTQLTYISQNIGEGKFIGLSCKLSDGSTALIGMDIIKKSIVQFIP